MVFDIVIEPSAHWSASWFWGLPLIVLTVVTHTLGLAVLRGRVLRWSASATSRRYPAQFAFVMGTIVLLSTALHAVEAASWAVAYCLLGALPDFASAMLYSLGALTTYGHANVYLAPHWDLMGALEALNGMLLFGLTTAFLFAIVDRAWRADDRLP